MSVVVVVIGQPENARGYCAQNWEHLGKGFLVEVEGMSLVHDQHPEDDILLVRRCA
jgi:hypothetical protein